MLESRQPIKHVEVERVASFDVLVNNRQTSVGREELDRLRLSIIEDLRTFPNDKPFTLWHQSPDHSRITVNSMVKPRYVAKKNG